MRRKVRERSILKDPAVEELHDVERGANDGGVIAKSVGAGDGDGGGGEGRDHAVFAIDLVGCGGKEGPGGFLAQDELRGCGCRGGEEVGWVRLAEAELQT